VAARRFLAHDAIEGPGLARNARIVAGGLVAAPFLHLGKGLDVISSVTGHEGADRYA
jgi:hypothetical protein